MHSAASTGIGLDSEADAWTDVDFESESGSDDEMVNAQSDVDSGSEASDQLEYDEYHDSKVLAQ